MPLLLDTHVVLWWLADDPALDDSVKDRLDVDSQVAVSVASIWEVGIKQASGKLTADCDLASWVSDAGFTLLPITAQHAIAAAALPPHHRDPFDRMLIAQASCDGFTIMTRDRDFAAYGVALEKI